jgi:hypothetical protein
VLAKLYIADGDDSKAMEYLNEIYSAIAIERMDFDNLLYARTCEALSQLTEGEESQQWLLEAYNTFPQMIPYSEGKLDFRVIIDGEAYNPGVKDQLLEMAVWLLITIVVLTVLYVAARRYLRFRHSAKWIYGGAGVVSIALLAFILWSISSADRLSPRERIISSLAECNIGFTDDAFAPVAELEFIENDSAMDVRYEITDGDGRLVNEGSVTVNMEEFEKTGILLAYRMFKINVAYTTASVEPVDVDEETPAAESPAE